MEPIFRAQGFDWKLDVALMSGIGAKEIVASTMGVLYGDQEDDHADDATKYDRMRQHMEADGITPLVAFSFLIFILLYLPCLATMVAIKNESGSWRWALFSALYTTTLAWILSAVVYQVGRII